jgi:Bacterial Ig domain
MSMRRGRRTVIWAVLSLVLVGAIHAATAHQIYTFSGTINAKGPKWAEHAFDVPHASVLAITLDRSDPGVEITVSLKDPSGTVVASTRASTLASAPLEYEADTAGTWSVLLRAKRGGVGYTLQIEVRDPNRAPVARDDGATTTSPNKVQVPVLGNDSDPDGDTLGVISVSAPNHGAANIPDARSVAYLPDDGFTGTDSFTYKVCDDGVPSLCTTAAVSVDVDAAALQPPPTTSPSPAPSGGSTQDPSPPLAPLVKGLSTRGGYSLDLGASIKRVFWSDLQPNAYGPIVHPNGIDAAMAHGTPFRVRIYAGRYAPQWVKDLGSVTITDPFQGSNETYVVPTWWTARYVNAYTDLITKLAADYDGRVPAFTMSGPMTVCAEPFLHQIGSAATKGALLAAGWSTAAERDAFEQMIDAHTVFVSARTFMAINPGQTYDPATGTWDPADVAYMKEITNYFVSTLGRHAIVQNNSLNVTRATKLPSYIAMYDYMRQLHASGVPISFQTAQTSLVEDLPWVLDYAVDAGAHLVELPERWSGLDTVDHLAAVDKELRANEP